MKRKLLHFLAYSFILLVLLVLGFVLFNHETAIYGYRQAKGQLKIIGNTEPIAKVLSDKNFPDSLKKKILLIEEIKRFAVDSLQLKPSENYTTFYDQHQKPILWVLTASEPFELKAKKWNFPVLGTFSYKGHFEKSIADAEITSLKKQGFDTQLNEVSAWSTLGYLKDPVLSSMLNLSEGRLAALIIHELTHGTIFVKDNLEFNENVGDFVGDYGAIRFLESKYGKNSEILKKHKFSKKYNDAYAQHLIRGAKKLDSLYKNFKKTASISEKNEQKTEMLRLIITSADTLLTNSFEKKMLTRKKGHYTNNNLPNNAYFIGYLTYQSKQNQFNAEFETQFNGNFAKYLSYLKKKYPTSLIANLW